MNQTEFHIIVPAYNAAKSIERCILSVMSQAYQDWRLVIVDDGSTDATGELAGSYAARDERITVLRQENGGQIAARSEGIDYAIEHFADDAYFMFLDSDDELKPNALTRIAQLIEENNCDLLIFGAERYDAATGRVLSVMQGDAAGIVESESDLFKIVLYDTVYNPVCFKAVSRKLVHPRDYSEYSALRYGEDLIQSLDYYRAAVRTYFSQDILYRYYLNSASVTRSVDFYSYPIDSTVRRITWETVTEEGVWNEREFDDYARFLLSLVEKRIISICRFKVPDQEKVKKLRAIRNDGFYSMLLDRKISHSRIIALLAAGQYKRLIAAAKIKKMTSVLKSRFSK